MSTAAGAPPAPQVPVTLLTGFLGSGKTTLLNAALRDPALARALVIVNEFGSVGIDHDLIDHSADAVVLLPNGCLCCAVRSDLADTLARLAARRGGTRGVDFDRLLIETSGLAEPSRLVDLFQTDPRLRGAMRLHAIVATLDAVNGAATLDAHDLASRQLALADRVRLTQVDLLQPDRRDAVLAALDERVRRIAPGAQLSRSGLGGGAAPAPAASADAARWLGLGDSGTPPRALTLLDDSAYAAPHTADPRIRRFHIVHDTPLTAAALQLFLDALERAAGPRLLRVKGLVHVAGTPGRPAVVHGAQQLVHRLAWRERWPSEDRRTRIVLLTMDMPERDILELLTAAQRLAPAGHGGPSAAPARHG